MKRTYFYTVVVLGCALLLAGCAGHRLSPESSSTPAQSAEQDEPSSAGTETTVEQPTATPTQDQNTTDAESPLPETELSESSSALLAEDFLSRSEDVDRFEMYFQILATYVYEPCTSAELESHQMIDPAIFMSGGNSAEVDEETGLMTLDQQDVTAWAEKLFGKTIDFDQLDEEYGYDFYVESNKDDYTITAHTFTDKIAVRGYGASIDNLNYQADGQNLYVVAPILKIEDRGIWEPYQTLRYEFVVKETETGTPYYSLQNVEKYVEEQ